MGGCRRLPKRLLGGYCRLQMPLRLALAVKETAAGHKLGALEGDGGGLSSPPRDASLRTGMPLYANSAPDAPPVHGTRTQRPSQKAVLRPPPRSPPVSSLPRSLTHPRLPVRTASTPAPRRAARASRLLRPPGARRTNLIRTLWA